MKVGKSQQLFSSFLRGASCLNRHESINVKYYVWYITQPERINQAHAQLLKEAQLASVPDDVADGTRFGFRAHTLTTCK